MKIRMWLIGIMEVILAIIYIWGTWEDFSHFKIKTISLFVSYISVCAVFTIGYFEYLAKIRRDKTAVLEKYNNRYLKDRNIRDSISVLMKLEEDRKPIDLSISEIRKREVFMRFFEELQLQIEGGALDEKDVHTLFGYYACFADQLNSSFVSDYYDDCWITFRQFVKRHKELSNSK